MTPDELALIEADGAVVGACRDEFAAAFYTALFELAPDARSLFPADLTEQGGKLVSELAFLVDAAAHATGHLDEFLDRARELGRRHIDYGVSGGHYVPVGAALQSALRTCVPGWDDDHELAWAKLYRLIADVMREGAESAIFAAD